MPAPRRFLIPARPRSRGCERPVTRWYRCPAPTPRWRRYPHPAARRRTSCSTVSCRSRPRRAGANWPYSRLPRICWYSTKRRTASSRALQIWPRHSAPSARSRSRASSPSCSRASIPAASAPRRHGSPLTPTAPKANSCCWSRARRRRPQRTPARRTARSKFCCASCRSSKRSSWPRRLAAADATSCTSVRWR